jgi:nitrate reductase NapE component
MIAPRYVSPKERAENRARWLRFAFWLAVIIPVAIALMMFGYSDQAPAWLRELTVSIDGTFGFPVLWLIKAIAAP